MHGGPVSVPLTKPITIVIHEQIFPSLVILAADLAKGSISKTIRLLIYTELLRRGLIDMALIEEIQ